MLTAGNCQADHQRKSAIMSMDGRYFARSHERRCDYVHGWTVFRKKPWKAVRLCPWMDGISQEAMEGGAI